MSGWSMTTEPVACSRCGQSWPRDPALEVICPQCHAPIGTPCHRPSGHGCALHAARDQAAMDAGKLVKCPGAPTDPVDNLDLFSKELPR